MKTILLYKKDKELTQEQIELLIKKYKTSLMPDYDYNLGFLTGIIGKNNLDELYKIITGSMILGIVIANKEKIVIKEINKKAPKTPEGLGSLSPGYVG